jgi:hypothetical protein
MWCFIVLLSSGLPCICVFHTALRARGASRLQGYLLLSLFTKPTLTGILFIKGIGRNSADGLSDYWLSGIMVEVVRPLAHFQKLSQLKRHGLTLLLCHCQFRYFAGPQHPWPLVWSTHYATTHTDYDMLTGQNNKISMQHCGCKLSLKSEKCNAVSWALNGVLQTNRMADKDPFIVACHHIIAVTLATSS